MDKVIKQLKLDDTLNKKHYRQKKYNSVWMEISPHANYNMMCDLIELPPTKKHNYKYLFTIVDLYTLQFDFEPVPNKESQTVLNAMLQCFKRNYVKKPYASISTDNGSEFKSVFHKWLWDENVFHKISLPYRHKQQSVIESLNSQITKLLMLYLNQKSKENNNGVPYSEWYDILPQIRTSLNDFRHKRFNKLKKFKDKYSLVDQVIPKSKFSVGNVVHYKLDYPENFDMKKQSSPHFRNGDYLFSQTTRKIIKVIYMNTAPFYRYMLDGIPNASYSEYELLPASVNFSTFIVKKIIDRKTDLKTKKVFYLVWWDKDLKRNATWEPKDQLLEDGLQSYIELFEEEKQKEFELLRSKLKEKQLKQSDDKNNKNNKSNENNNDQNKQKYVNTNNTHSMTLRKRN